jgi:hypothetical protein
VLPRATTAEAPPVKSTGIFSYKVGDCEVIQLRDGARTFAMPDTFVINVSKVAAALAATPTNKVRRVRSCIVPLEAKASSRALRAR